jgi:hypothetical protein
MEFRINAAHFIHSVDRDNCEVRNDASTLGISRLGDPGIMWQYDVVQECHVYN